MSLCQPVSNSTLNRLIPGFGQLATAQIPARIPHTFTDKFINAKLILHTQVILVKDLIINNLSRLPGTSIIPYSAAHFFLL